MVLDGLEVPIVLAPLAGGPSTPELAAAVADAGGLGFLGAGYLSADALAQRVKQTRSLTSGAFGVNLFVIRGEPAPPDSYADYLDSLQPDAERLGVEVGTPVFDDDAFDAKVDVLLRDPVPVVSFTFALPPRDVVQRFKGAGTEVWITVTTPAEAEQAEATGADGLAIQGAEAGGHRGSFDDSDDQPLELLPLLERIRQRTRLPLVAAGGIATAAQVDGVLSAGAQAVAAGTAFMLAPEAGTVEAHRQAIASSQPTALTRAFTGKRARGIQNRFMDDHPGAPRAYPEIHYATAPLRARARELHDADGFNLWAGANHELAVARPAGETVRALAGR